MADILANNAFRDASSSMDFRLRKHLEELSAAGLAAAMDSDGGGDEASVQQVRRLRPQQGHGLLTVSAICCFIALQRLSQGPPPDCDVLTIVLCLEVAHRNVNVVAHNQKLAN